MNAIAKVGVIVALLAGITAVYQLRSRPKPAAGPSPAPVNAPARTATPLPRLVDLGSHSCIPCKKMAPILDELRTEFAGRLNVEFIDVRENADAASAYGIRLIPTQIFFDATGRERFRHEGFMSRQDILAQWAALGITLAVQAPPIIREAPLRAPSRAVDAGCFMCDQTIEPTTRVQVKTAKAVRSFCTPHCFFIYLSSLPTPAGIEEATTVTDANARQPLPAREAFYRVAYDADGRPTVHAVAASAPGTLKWETLKEKELAVRCAFCDRATYPEDSSRLKVGGANLHACCPVCGLGAAARLQKDIELQVKDALTGVPLQIRTLGGNVESLDPPTIVAWHGQKKSADGKMASAGCFKQFFFATRENLEKWLQQHPEATGKTASISELLADKMKLSPAQIRGACKIGDCVE